MKIDLSRIFMFFVIYSFIGWLVETIYCSTLEGKFVYRGFLNGPFCPIYGFGALFILLLLNGLKTNPLLLFLASMMITSILEYITSYILEKIFNMKWWDYSDKKYNINGRVCLLNSTLFGFLSMFLIEIAHPATIKFINSFSYKQQKIISILFFIYFLSDTLFTVLSLLELEPKLKYISDIELNMDLKIEKGLEEWNEKWNLKKEEYKIDKEALLSKLSIDFSNRRLLKSYPKLRFKKHPKAVENLRKILESKKNK